MEGAKRANAPQLPIFPEMCNDCTESWGPRERDEKKKRRCYGKTGKKKEGLHQKKNSRHYEAH